MCILLCVYILKNSMSSAINISCKICKVFFFCDLHFTWDAHIFSLASDEEVSVCDPKRSSHLFHSFIKMNVCLCPGPLYGSLLRAWQYFLSSADRLSSLHSSICQALVSEDGDRIRTWQKDTFHKKIFGGFKESQDFETGFSRAQKPWGKRLKKVESNAGILDYFYFFY